MKITTLEFPSTILNHEFPEGALVADLLAKLGDTAILKMSNIVMTPEQPLQDGMRLAVSRKDATTGVVKVEKIAGANDLQLEWKKAILNDETTLSFEEYASALGQATASTEKIDGAITFSFEKASKVVEYSNTLTQFEGVTVLSILQQLGLSTVAQVEVNGEKTILGYVIKDGDKVVVY